MSNDLISRCALLRAMENRYNIAEAQGFVHVGLTEGFLICENLINEQPTAYDVNKVVEEIKKEREEAKEYNQTSAMIAHEIDIEIVKAGDLNG